MGDDEIGLYKSEDHMGNFIECIKSRSKPAASIEAAVQSDLISHLSNAAIRLNAAVELDPDKETAAGDAEKVNKLISRKFESPWSFFDV